MKRFFAMTLGLAFTFLACSCDRGGGGSSSSGDKKFDYNSLPFYNAGAASGQYDAQAYANSWIFRPYWQGNVIYNELITLTDDGSGPASGTLQYPALKIISVRDYTLKQEFKEGTDYAFDGDKKLTAVEGSDIPIFKAEWLRGENIPSEYREVPTFGDITNSATDYTFITPGVLFTESSLIYKRYLSVTYVYDPALVNRDIYGGIDFSFDVLRAKLEGGDNISILVHGDSVAEGCSSSQTFDHEPYSPDFSHLVKQGIETVYGVETTYKNIAVGGMTSEWGAEDAQLMEIRKAKADLVMIHFSGNDAGSQLSARQFERNYRKIIESARAANNNCALVFCVYVGSHPDYATWTPPYIEEYRQVLCSLAEEYGAYVADMKAVGDEMLEKGLPFYYIDVNNCSHPNDYVHRLYAMKILSALIDWQAVK